ncbi:hypothetical protein, partial [Erwinia amylovora]|uniref:hypothetical protein n=1 Tax=Erwinia amylovora TaxID=552 RepID=UPI001963B8A6
SRFPLQIQFADLLCSLQTIKKRAVRLFFCFRTTITKPPPDDQPPSASRGTASDASPGKWRQFCRKRATLIVVDTTLNERRLNGAGAQYQHGLNFLRASACQRQKTGP